MNMNDTPLHSALLISVREARLTQDRIFLAAGVPDGLVPSVREHALVSAALGLGGFAMTMAQHAAIGASCADAQPLCTVTGDDPLAIDGRGHHAWLIGATVLDLVLAAAQATGRGHATLHRVDCADELAALAALANRHGARAEVRVTGTDATLDVTLQTPPRTLAEWDPVIERALRDGLACDAALWWQLHHLSNRALSPDTVESRRHAGPIIVAEDGSVIGRPVDDDTDMSLLHKAEH